MSYSVPSKVEVMGWSPPRLADYMRSLKLSGCDKLVLKGYISGAQFMQMTACDLQAFPSLYVPIISKIQSEITKEDQKRVFGYKLKAVNQPKQVFVQREEFESDEFDSESDKHSSGSGSEEGEEGYICPLTVPPTAERPDGEGGATNAMPPSAENMKPSRRQWEARLEDGHCREPLHERTSKLPQPLPPRPSHLPQRPFKAPAHPAEGSAVKASTSRMPIPAPSKPADAASRAGQMAPTPQVRTKFKAKPPTAEQSQGLDPSWYGGKVTRNQAEAALRQVNKDGAFVVRDSSHGTAEHPYTLMLLKQGKVYNIRIRNHGNSYSLGTGPKSSKSFPGVTEMITHHTNTPLLFLDATDQSSGAQSKCCLLHPAGL